MYDVIKSEVIAILIVKYSLFGEKVIDDNKIVVQSEDGVRLVSSGKLTPPDEVSDSGGHPYKEKSNNEVDDWSWNN